MTIIQKSAADLKVSRRKIAEPWDTQIEPQLEPSLKAGPQIKIVKFGGKSSHMGNWVHFHLTHINYSDTECAQLRFTNEQAQNSNRNSPDS